MILESIASIATLMLIFFIISIITKDNSYIDIAWGLGFILIATIAFLQSTQETIHYVVFSLVALWGIRLSGFISLRKIGYGEDHRYADWRKEWKYFYTRSFFQIYVLQGVLMFIFAWPIFYVMDHSSQFTSVLAIGILLWIIGFFFEAVGDAQKYSFKKKNPKDLMITGLWKYTRHPNYFGESVQWFGIAVIAAAAGGWYTMLSPILLTFFLIKVSGVPMLEVKYKGRPNWESYKAKTSMFVPWVQKK
jgi:steroid 5-alpha reductase family enzyme